MAAADMGWEKIAAFVLVFGLLAAAAFGLLG